jgi:hypothetical protein
LGLEPAQSGRRLLRWALGQTDQALMQQSIPYVNQFTSPGVVVFHA